MHFQELLKQEFKNTLRVYDETVVITVHAFDFKIQENL